MRKHSELPPGWEALRAQVIGFGDDSIRKSYYPELQQRLAELERFRALLDQSNDAIFLVETPSGRLADANESACVQAGYTRDELLGTPVGDLIDLAGLAGADPTGPPAPGGTTDTVLRKRDGGHVPVEIAVRRVTFHDVLYAVVVARDVTDRTQAEEALRQSERGYRSLYEHAHDAILVLDSAGERVLDVNRRACALYGLDRSEFVGRRVQEISADPDRARRFIREAFERGELLEVEATHLRADGARLEVEINASVVEYKGQRALLTISRDVTRRKQLEAQLRHAQRMEAVGRLAGGVAHDFNNLLTVIAGYSEFLLMSVKPGEPLRQEAEEIRKAAARAAALTRQLLAFSRKQLLQPKVLDLNEVVADLDKMLRRLIGEDIDLLVVLDPALRHVKVDPSQIEQVVVNLAVNARDAMPGGGQLSIETANASVDEAFARRHAPMKPGAYVQLTVSDTGCGMDAETLDHIFEPFFTTKEVGRGTGLGLATVYGIVKQSEGYVFARSHPGRGTTFEIYLPRAHGEADAAGREQDRWEELGGPETVLLVEDEDGVRQLAAEALRRSGFRVLEARHGSEALAVGEGEGGPIHLLVTDVVMPRMGGRELAERVCRMRPETRVLYMSGYTEDAMVRHGVRDEHVAFLEKPFTPAMLVRKAREALGRTPGEGHRGAG